MVYMKVGLMKAESSHCSRGLHSNLMHPLIFTLITVEDIVKAFGVWNSEQKINFSHLPTKF